jgi:hypothetical protein
MAIIVRNPPPFVSNIQFFYSLRAGCETSYLGMKLLAREINFIPR